MRRAAVALALAGLALRPSPGSAWESKCYEFTNPWADRGLLLPTGAAECDPAGPNIARQRWIAPSGATTPLDEHRQLFATALTNAGLGSFTNPFGHTQQLRVYTASTPITIAGASLTSLVPVEFRRATRVQPRYLTPEEFAQLPDFSYALWDWASGNETCPTDASTPAEECHAYTTHLGPVNSSHFLPQAANFYALYHGLATSRARECGIMHASVPSAQRARFREYNEACETEAMTLEAVASHYLQDAWSSGHMWQRWGSPDLADFPSDAAQARAVLVAAISGIIHGSRALVQPQVDTYVNSALAQTAICASAATLWFTDFPFLATVPSYLCGVRLDVRDPLCSPLEGVEYVASIAGTGFSREPGGGDDFLPELPPFQRQRLEGCAAASARQVYDLTGHAHGEAGTLASSASGVDPTGAGCTSQRATNRAFLLGMSIRMVDAGPLGRAIPEVPLDPALVSYILPRLLSSMTGVTVPDHVSEELRADLISLALEANAWASASPVTTEVADGALPPMLGVNPNGAYARSAPARLATYQDPSLPWPAAAESTSDDQHAMTLARVFHRAHALEWCRRTTEAELLNLRLHAQDTSLDLQGRAAACEVCTEMALRHLRVGSDASHYDTTAEPLCHYLTAGPYVYSPARGTADPSTVARAWCDCAHTANGFVLTERGLARVTLSGASVTRGTIAGGSEFLALGERPRAMATSARNGFRAVVTNFNEGSVSIVDLTDGAEREIDTDQNAMTTWPATAPAGVTRISVGANPRGVAVTLDGRYALVLVSGTDEVVVLDLDDYSRRKRFPIGRDPGVIEYPDDVVLTRNGLRAYVSLAGTASAPGRAVGVLDIPIVVDFTSVGGEVRSYLTDLGGDPQPGAMAVSPDGAHLAITGRGNNLIIMYNIATNEPEDIYPSDPSRRWPDAASSPWAVAWSPDSTRVHIANLGGVSGTRLAGYGTARIRRIDGGTGAPLRYDVGVLGAARAIALSEDGDYTYIGDALGNITALPLSHWDGASTHFVPPYTDETGGCLESPRMRYAVPCAATLSIGSPIRALWRY
jgi:DNA-binding beta-propeller fold protein YncE